MHIVVQILLLVVGFVCLVKGADVFVSGSSALARFFRVPGLIIGLTIVALGTSAPELAVSTLAAVEGSNEIALSNVIGSNIFNLLCVLGICAIICPLPVERAVLRRDFPVSIVTTAVFLISVAGTAMLDGTLQSNEVHQEISVVTRWHAGVLVAVFIAYIAYLIYAARKNETEDGSVEQMPLWKCALLIILGLAFIIGGGQAVVTAAKEIAAALGMSETLIGLTIVAIGTSLPELVTSIVAARKGETGLAIGNVVGSNIFNLLFILGVSAMIHPIAVNIASVYDMIILLGVSILSFVFAYSAKRIASLEGWIMVVIYVADVVFAILR